MKKRLLNFINGKFTEFANAKYLDVFNPAKGEKISEVTDSTAQDVDLAVEAAQRAFPAWSEMPTRERAQCLRRLAALIEKNLDTFAELESLNTGKPFKLAKALDIPRSAYNLEFFADAATQFSSESYSNGLKTLNYTSRQPLGTVGCISPWNLPLYLFTWKIAPALASGNCVVAKPSEITPLTADFLAELSIASGLPPGAFNVIHGRGSPCGAALCTHPKVKAVSFTGSTRTGAEISKTAGPLFKKLSLELGGKNATVIFADCDFAKAVSETLRSAFLNQGQICLCGSRILVEKSIYSKFKEALLSGANKLVVGDPFAPNTDQGSLVSKEHYEKVRSCLKRARDEGGTLLCGGDLVALPSPFDRGYFLSPTLIEGLPMSALTNQEEIFGPVATLMPFENEVQAVELANATRYGLAATLWTKDLARAHRMAAKLEAGIVWINTWMNRDLRTPFGGVKDSGVGREGGFEALKFFTESKNICLSFEEGSTP